MTDYNLLRAAAYKKGLTFEKLAARVGISKRAFSLKANSKRDFCQTEMEGIMDVLGLSADEAFEIFFADVPDGRKEVTA